MSNECDVESLIISSLEKTRQLCEAREYKLAEVMCRQIIRVDKENDQAWLLLGISCGFLGKTDDAKEALSNAAQYTKLPENKEFANNLLDRMK
jgi:Flp pilus assembly protein TadD